MASPDIKNITIPFTFDRWIALRRLQEAGVIKSITEGTLMAVDLFVQHELGKLGVGAEDAEDDPPLNDDDEPGCGTCGGKIN